MSPPSNDSSPASGESLSPTSELEPRLAELFARYTDLRNEGNDSAAQELLQLYPDLAGKILSAAGAAAKLQRLALPLKVPATLGEFRILSELGTGGMGIVYQAWQPSMERQVALKVLWPEHHGSPRTVQRFQREAKIAGKLHHPNIVSVYGTASDEGVLYLVTELVEGKTLEQILASLRPEGAPSADASPTAEREGARIEAFLAACRGGAGAGNGAGAASAQEGYRNVAKLFSDVARGLQHAHERGVVHRDIKPGNLIADFRNGIRILDFGLARLSGEPIITGSHIVMGTPLYMSPEQAAGRLEDIDTPTDVYGLGATLYEVLTDHPVFPGKSQEELVPQILHTPPQAPSRWSPGLPRLLETVCLKCLEKTPSRRYGSGAALAEDLEEFARDRPIRARRPSWCERAAQWVLRRKLPVALATLSLLLLVAGSLLIVAHRRAVATARAAAYDEAVGRAALEIRMTEMVGLEGSESFGHAHRGWLVLPGEHILVSGTVRDTLEATCRSLEDIAQGIDDRPDAHYYRARGLFLLGEAGKAREAVERALKARANFVPALLLDAAILRRTGGLSASETALEHARQLLARTRQREEQSAMDAWLRAHLTLLERRWQDAVEALDGFLNSQTHGRVREPYVGVVIESFLGRGIAHLELGHPYQALEDFAQARAQRESFVVPSLLLGKTYLLLGQAAQAARNFDAAAREERFQEEVALTVASIYADAGSYQEALRWLTSRVASPLSRAKHKALIFSHTGDWEAAIESGETAVGLAPRDSQALVGLAIAILGGNGDATRAEALLLKAMEIDGSDARAHHNLGVVREKQGRPGEAMELYRKALAIDRSFAEAHLHLGRLLLAGGDAAEALRELQEATRFNPKSAATHSALGEALDRQGREGEALAAFRTAVELDPRGAWQTGRIERLLGRRRVPSLSPRIRGLVEAYAALNPELGDEALLHHSVQQWIQAGGPREGLLRALGSSFLAVDIARSKNVKDPRGLLLLPEIESALAEVLFLAGNAADAVVIAEGALERPDARVPCLERLRGYRQAVLPDLVSYASIDAALSTAAPMKTGLGRGGTDSPAGELPFLWDEAREAAARRGARHHVLYLEGRVLQKRGSFLDAAAKFEYCRAKDPTAPEPMARLAECFQGARQPAEALRRLTEALRGPLGAEEDLWRLWLQVAAVDLGKEPEELLRILKELPTAGRTGPHEDLLWALEALCSTGVLRIDCGGQAHGASDRGAEWGRDRFCAAGITTSDFALSIGNTVEPLIYQTDRWFPGGTVRPPGYRVPVPPGRYSVTLHWAETWFRSPGERVFSVSLEGIPVLQGYDPGANGFAKADSRTFEALVQDSSLDIELFDERDCPELSAIEVRRLGGDPSLSTPSTPDSRPSRTAPEKNRGSE